MLDTIIAQLENYLKSKKPKKNSDSRKFCNEIIKKAKEVEQKIMTENLKENFYEILRINLNTLKKLIRNKQHQLPTTSSLKSLLNEIKIPFVKKIKEDPTLELSFAYLKEARKLNIAEPKERDHVDPALNDNGGGNAGNPPQPTSIFSSLTGFLPLWLTPISKKTTTVIPTQSSTKGNAGVPGTSPIK